MKKLYTFLILVGCCVQAYPQHQAASFTFNQPLSGGGHHYQARDFIDMEPGFEYEAITPGEEFVAEINPFLLFPPTAGITGGPNPGDNGVVGATAGIFSVNELGQASYIIPLEFPGGIGSMTPDISIVYNSNGGDGILGPGWSLGGLSVINLVPANRYYDGIFKTAYGGDYIKDTYTLDGQRLILIEELNNDQLVFRTEQDVFSKIIRKNVAKIGEKDGMSYRFEVKTKSGLTYHYGEFGYDDSRLRHKIETSTYTIAYYVNRIVDNFGNTIEFRYDSIVGGAFEDLKGEIYIDEITYTSNGEIDPIYRIKFNYRERNSPHITYYSYQTANSPTHTLAFQTNKLIDTISCVYIPDGSVVKKYALDYIDRGAGTNTANKTQHLASIQEFGLNGQEKYNKTVFEWEEEMDYGVFESLTMSIPQTIKTSWGPYSGNESIVRYINYQFSDVNNDMKTDIIRTYEWIMRTPSPHGWFYNCNHKIVIEIFNMVNESQFELINYIEIPYQEYEQIYAKPLSEGKFFVSIADFTGNGWNDLLINKWRYSRDSNIFGFKGVDVVLYLNNKNGSFNEHDVYSNSELQFYNYIADFNGDGIADLLLQNRKTENTFIIWRLGAPNNPLGGNVDSRNGQNLIYNPQNSNLKVPLQIADFNGDGRADIYTEVPSNSGNGKVYYLIPEGGNIIFDVKDIYSHHSNSKTFCYLNKDRKMDFVTANIDCVFDHNYYEGVNGTLNLDLFHGSGLKFNKYGSQSFDLGSLPDSCIFQYYVWDYINIRGDIINFYGIDFRGNGSQDFILKVELDFFMEKDLGQGNFEEYNCTEYLYYIILINSTGTGFELNGPYSWLDQFITQDGIRITDINGNNQQDFYRIISNNGNTDTIDFRISSPHGSRIKRITNGMGAVTKIEYAYSSDSNVYRPGTSVNYPIIPYEANQSLVIKVERDNGQGGFFVEQYFYYDARAHTEGLGYLGFKSINRSDLTRRIVHNTEYALNNLFYYTYPKKTIVRTIFGNKIKETTNTYAHKASQGLHDKSYYYVHPDTITTLYYELGITSYFKGERNIYKGFDQHGNPGTIKTEYGEYSGNSVNYTHSTQVVHEYYDPITNDTNWILSRLKEAITTFKAPNTPDIMRKASFEYYDSGKTKGMLKKEITEPYNPLYRVEKEYVYDDYGNILTTTIHAPSLGNQHNRITTTTYKDGRFVEFTTNPEQHTSKRVYEAKHGLLLQETDPNNFTTTIEYSAFGHPLKTIAHDGNQSVSVLRWVQNDPMAPSYATYYSWSQSSGIAPVKVYYNKIGMELSTVTMDFNGDAVFVETLYNDKGQIASKSEPHKGSATHFNNFSYDDFGRVHTIIHPDITTSTIAYNGLTTSTTNALNQTSKKTENVAGWLIASKDATGNTVRHQHYANGQVKMTYFEGNPNTKREYTYDAVGNTESYNDLSQGNINYQYNAFGELIQLTTPKGTTTYHEYDKLGRLRKRDSPEGITTWEYDIQGKGLIKEEKLVSNGNTVHKLVYNYDNDNMLRLESLNETIMGEDFTKGFGYDIFGRTVEQIFPSGYAVQYTYNNQGYQNIVIEAGTGNTLWEALGMNERNQFTEIKLGNQINQFLEYFPATGRLKKMHAGSMQNNTFTWDQIGNLQTRKTRHNTTESFIYDNLNRLITVYHNAENYTTINYDQLGNITYKSDVGSYSYDTFNPYKLVSINNRPSTINADNQHITYNSFNKVTQITEEDPANSAILRQLDLVYGTANQRIFHQMQNGTDIITKYYAGGDYEVENKNGIITRMHYIYTPSGLAAIVMRNAQNNDELNFVLNDHIGSIQVLANSAGQLLEEFSYDPWGQRRDPVTLVVYAWSAMPVTGIDYGFTGHEHLDIFMLVNMNGRIYDPTIGRFLSPDPILQLPNFTQGLNPYSYALNNPLRFVDPNGYSLVGQLFALSASMIIGSIPGVNILLVPLVHSVIMTIDYAIEKGRNIKAADLFGNFIQSFVMSSITMGATQSIGDYMKEAANAGKSAIELRRAMAHAIFNGAMRWAQGGKFEHGFLSGFVSSLGGSYLSTNGFNMSGAEKIAISAAIGGTAEALGGGKFANGAVTGAYVMMFNHMMYLPQTGAIPKILNSEHRKLLRTKIEEAAFQERVERNRQLETNLDKNDIFVSFDIGIKRGSSIWDNNMYSAENLEVTIGNKTITVDVILSVQNDMNVVRFYEPKVDATIGGRFWLQARHHYGDGFIVQIKYHAKEDFKTFNAFIKAHKKY